MKITITIDLDKVGYDPLNPKYDDYLDQCLDDLKIAHDQVIAAYEDAKQKYRADHGG